MPTYSVTITDEQDRALRGIIEDPQAWITHAFLNKVRKCQIRIIEQHSTHRANALTEQEKDDLIAGLTFETAVERNEREMQEIIEKAGLLE